MHRGSEGRASAELLGKEAERNAALTHPDVRTHMQRRLWREAGGVGETQVPWTEWQVWREREGLVLWRTVV